MSAPLLSDFAQILLRLSGISLHGPWFRSKYMILLGVWELSKLVAAQSRRAIAL